MAISFATENDIPQILEIYAPYVEHTAVSFEYTVPTLPAFTCRFRDITAQYPWLVWREGERVLGYAYASPNFTRTAFCWGAQVSIYLCPQAQGKGIGRRLYAAIEYLLEKQGYHKAYGVITTHNPDSIAFHGKVGYHKVAELPDCGFKLGQWHGIVWMEKMLKFDEKPTAMPVPIWEVVKSDENIQKVLAKISIS